MNGKPELLGMGLAEQPGVGKAMPGDLLWRAEWASPVATATTIQKSAPKQGVRFR